MEIDEVNWSIDVKEVRCLSEWTRNDYGTTRLMMPGRQGPKWSSCTRRKTIDLDSGQIIEDRDVNEIVGREKRRMFKSGSRNISTTFTYEAAGETIPFKWKCSECKQKDG